MKTLVRLLIIGTVVSMLHGCVAWTRVEQPRTQGPGGHYTVDLPDGWMRASFRGDRILITRDGFGLQVIEVIRVDHDKAFSQIEKASSPDMLPSELAELTLADARAEATTEHLQVVSNEPVVIGGRPGFRLQFEFKNPRSLRYERVTYGMAAEDGYYRITYQAPRLHYFERDLNTFESIVHSFRRGDSGTRQARETSTGGAG